jgi:hypothetical protein
MRGGPRQQWCRARRRAGPGWRPAGSAPPGSRVGR